MLSRNYSRNDFSQYILPIGIIAVAYYGLNKLFKSESGKNQSQESQDETVDKIKKEVNKKNLTQSDAWFSQTADFLQDNLVKTWKNWEPARDCLQKIYGLKNPDDWKYLITVFEVRKPRSLTNTFQGGNLQSWLRYFMEDVYYRDKNGEKWKEARYIDILNTYLKYIKAQPI